VLYISARITGEPRTAAIIQRNCIEFNRGARAVSAGFAVFVFEDLRNVVDPRSIC
jgi:hypothetical protein